MEPAKWFVGVLMLFLVGAPIVFGLVGLLLEVEQRLRARKMSTDELQRIVFGRASAEGFDFDWYLDYVGRDRPSVRRFLTLIEARDLPRLYREWPALEKDFLRGEDAAGHRGRPLIMDCMFHYRSYVRELMRRRD